MKSEIETTMQAQIEALKAEIEQLKNQPHGFPRHTPTGAMVREARRSAAFHSITREIDRDVEAGKLVRCRVLQVQEKIVNKKRVREDVSRTIHLNPSWKNVWKNAPATIEAFDDRGEPIVHELPQRVFTALQPDLVLESEAHKRLAPRPLDDSPARAA